MQVIASDSYDLQPVTVDSLVSTSGERYDFVINANQPTGECWFDLFGHKSEIMNDISVFQARIGYDLRELDHVRRDICSNLQF